MVATAAIDASDIHAPRGVRVVGGATPPVTTARHSPRLCQCAPIPRRPRGVLRRRRLVESVVESVGESVGESVDKLRG
jgi:hypothetical protein